MIDYTERLDKAIRIAAWAHEQEGQHRKGSDIPYVIHPFGVMLIASNATDDEDTLIGCLLHDVLEDVEPTIYGETEMNADFGSKVVSIVKDVSKNESMSDWHDRCNAYLNHIEQTACDEAVIVCTSDKIHNLQSVLTDYKNVGDELWNRFTTKRATDQLWWYQSVLEVITKRNAPQILQEDLTSKISELKNIIS